MEGCWTGEKPEDRKASGGQWSRKEDSGRKEADDD
jgi:hypothetical protein